MFANLFTKKKTWSQNTWHAPFSFFMSPYSPEILRSTNTEYVVFCIYKLVHDICHVSLQIYKLMSESQARSKRRSYLGCGGRPKIPKTTMWRLKQVS